MLIYMYTYDSNYTNLYINCSVYREKLNNVGMAEKCINKYRDDGIWNSKHE